MAELLQSMQIAGFPSVANAGNPATGAGLLGSCVVEYWSDGALVIVPTSGIRVRLPDTPKLNHLLEQILKGTNGLSTTKMFHKGS